MFNRIKRKILRAKLQKEKVGLLIQLVEVKKKIKILDELDRKEN